MPQGHQGYSSTAKVMHWLIMVLVLVQFVIAALMPDIGPRTVPGTLVDLHLSLGVLILLLTLLRLLNRQLDPVPLEAADSPGWEGLAARALHLVFYFVLVVAPFLGWASASAHRLPVTLFGIATLPALAEPGARWALKAGDLHALMMWILLGLIVLHAAAALYHHLIRGDAVLQRMLPARRR